MAGRRAWGEACKPAVFHFELRSIFTWLKRHRRHMRRGVDLDVQHQSLGLLEEERIFLPDREGITDHSMIVLEP